MLDPPFVGAVNVRDATVSLVLVAVPIVGVSGTVVAVIELEAGPEKGEVPLALVAVAVKVYDVLDCKPVTVNGDDPVAVKLPGEDVTAYDVTLPPPVAAAVAVIVAEPLLNALDVPTFAALRVGPSGISSIGVVY